MAEEIWGPAFSEYITQDFEPRIIDISPEEAKEFRKTYNAHPLASIETSLRKLDPRAYTPDVIHSGDLLQAMSQYSWVTEHHPGYKVFGFYYGFLCIRHLIQLTCLALLGNPSTLHKLVQAIPSNASWGQMSRVVAREALDKAAETMTSPAQFKEFGANLIGPYIRGTEFGKNYVTILLWTLFRDRESLLALYVRNMLPGCTILLLLIFGSLEPDSDFNGVPNVIAMKDIIFRLYLAGSPRDRSILECMLAVLLHVPYIRGDDNSFVSPEDSIRISQAYSGLVFLWQQARSGLHNISFPIMQNLMGFVLHMQGFNSSATAREQIQVSRTALRHLWLLFESRPRTPAVDHFRFRAFGRVVLYYLG
ncbi:MYND Zn-finger protein [Ceratobasidium sp. AG-Ba]|nr:MYND Zn-finger protein [Ceratobasidium sp. AG-Ba]